MIKSLFIILHILLSTWEYPEWSGTGPITPIHSSSSSLLQLHDTPQVVLDKLIHLEHKSLAILARFEHFTPITEEDKDKLIQSLASFYTPDQAQTLFEQHYRQRNDGYIRVPTDYISIKHIQKHIQIFQQAELEHTLLKITGEDEHHEFYEFRYILNKDLTLIADIQVIQAPY
ncbi:hypothetical protein WMW72_11785 [Paenibacillus filicis]|uniref:Uncharacterized protein n=1 Tax=Paenibacillus filicis TaxID=669464 RepID=A0ABU9DI86_9BACL